MIFLLSIVLTLSRAQQELEPFSRLLLDKFEHQSRSALLEEELAALRPQLKIRQESAAAVLQTTRASLEHLFSSRIEALRKLARAAENAAKGYIHDTPDAEFHIPLDEASCEKELARMNDSDVRLLDASDDDGSSGVHINIESYRCDPKVRRDFSWTGSDNVEKTMANNKQLAPEMRHQFIGTYSGVTRMYPRRRWEIEPAAITIDLFDPMFRPWFVNSEAAPKDIVFMIDFSGSVKGPTMHLVKITMMYILSTLSPNDHFYGVYFSSSFGSILECHNNTFLPATTVNKRLFFEKLAEIEEKDQAHMSTPFKFSMDVLRNNLESNSSLFSYSRSNGHKLLMLFTDGIDDWDTDMLNVEIGVRGTDPIQVFGFSMGYGTGPLPLLDWLACNTFAAHSVVDSIMDVKPQSRAFLDNLSKVMGKRLENIPVEERNISWTNLYMEAQGLGPTVTISLPILPKRGEIVWTHQGLAGIAGVDIGLSELTNNFPSGEQVYAMIVDHNGIVLYHPKLVLPKTEIHCVRRSACYDASQVKAKAGSGLRVQYGFSDQRVYRLVGLIDSIPTIDLFEIEGTSLALNELRDQIIHGTCTERPILDTDREYACSKLAGTPFSVVVVSSNTVQTVVAADYQTEMTVSYNHLVGNFLSKRQICNWKLDRIDAQLRFAAMQGLAGCEDELSTTRLMVSAVSKWADSWTTPDSKNKSCEEMTLPPGIEPRYFVSSFVHTRAQVTTYFPACASQSLKPLTAKFDNERLVKDDVKQLQMSVRNDNVFAYRAISDDNGNRIAVVGTQWHMDYIDKMFRNWINSSSLWSSRCKKKDCLLVSRSGFTVGSNTLRRPTHLAVFDPQLFAALDYHKLVNVSSWIDAQAECMAKKTAPWSSSSSPGSRSSLRYFLNSLVPLLQKPFWLDLYNRFVSPARAQPQMRNGICSFQKIKPVERCFVKNWQYSMRLNITKQIDINDAKCTRYARVFSVPGTMLTLIEADRACPGYKPKRTYPTEPQKLESCEKVSLYPRYQPPPLVNNISMADYDYSRCDASVSSSHSGGLHLILVIWIISRVTGLLYL